MGYYSTEFVFLFLLLIIIIFIGSSYYLSRNCIDYKNLYNKRYIKYIKKMKEVKSFIRSHSGESLCD